MTRSFVTVKLVVVHFDQRTAALTPSAEEDDRASPSPSSPDRVTLQSTITASVAPSHTMIVGTTYIQCGLRSRMISSPSFSSFFG